MESGIFLIGHLVNTDGKLMLFGEFKRKCPAFVKKTCFLMYEGVLKAIREYQKVKEIILTML